MDNQILITVLRNINLDEMITTAESADRTLNTLSISQFTVAVKILQFIKTDLPAVMHISSTRNIGANHIIQFLKVNFPMSDAYAEHTASNIHANDVRNYFVGKQVADYYQNLAYELMCGKDDLYDRQEKLIADYKAAGRKSEIESAIKELHRNFRAVTPKLPKDLCYLEGKYREQYLHDMRICQKFAYMNRVMIAQIICDHMGWGVGVEIPDYFECIHNYIDHDSNIVRKGAISAKYGEKVLIPINMRDGCILGTGKGNEDWNCSAPHGAGRIMSRMKAKETLNMSDYSSSMDGIYTTSVSEETIDEAPMAYKPIDEIVECIGETVDILAILKPVYNFKASE